MKFASVFMSKAVSHHNACRGFFQLHRALRFNPKSKSIKLSLLSIRCLYPPRLSQFAMEKVYETALELFASSNLH
jgi:hypothetical protein